MKICKKCKINKENSEFYIRNRKGKKYLYPRCKSCETIRTSSITNEKRKLAAQLRRKNYPEAHKNAKSKYVSYKRDIVNKIKSAPCSDCGIQFHPICMDFDHIRGDKIDSVSSMVIRNSIEDILKEIEKCELVCANCHRLRTYFRDNIGT